MVAILERQRDDRAAHLQHAWRHSDLARLAAINVTSVIFAVPATSNGQTTRAAPVCTARRTTVIQREA